MKIKIMVKVIGVQESYAVVIDADGKQAEWKYKKMCSDNQKKFDNGTIINMVLELKYVDKISKKCPYVVEE